MDPAKQTQLADLKARFDDLVLAVLGPLRLRKEVDAVAMDELKNVLDELRLLLGDEPYVPRKFTGELWFIFMAMLAEADHAKDPEPILREAWDVAERLQGIFGPR